MDGTANSKLEKASELERQRCQAMEDNDVELLSELFSDDLLWIHSSAKIDDKRSFLNSIETGAVRYVKVFCSEQKFRMFDDVAIVSGIVKLEAIANGVEKKAVNRFTCVWSLRDSKFLAWQSTAL